MGKRIILSTLLIIILGMPVAWSQVQWRDTTTQSAAIEWNNYSTSYINPSEDLSVPIIVTAIPYNGKYNDGDTDDSNAPFDMTFTGSLFRYRSALTNSYHRLYTYDSGNVYFMTPGIHPYNAKYFEYKVLLNGTKELMPWTAITRFTDDSFQLNEFEKKMGWLGGFKTTWNNQVTVAIRRKGTDSVLAAAAVQWKNIQPAILDIYIANELNVLLNMLSKPFGNNNHHETTKYKAYTSGKQDSATGPAKPFTLASADNNLFIYLEGTIFKKEVLEYALLKDGELWRNWKYNETDYNYIWLKDLPPGNYKVSIRFTAQRHNVTSFPFTIMAAWYQTLAFKIIAGLLLLIALGFIYLLFRLAAQKRKTALEQLKKAQLKLELQAVYAQLNPHFIFNALHSIQGLVNNNDIAGANRYLAEFGKLVRDSLASQGKDVVPLSQELQSLDTYLQLEQLRFGFQYHIEQDEHINAYETDIPALLLQPLVENAVKHGIGTMQDKGKIQLRITALNKDMHISIQDNGVGFILHPTRGYGLKLTSERIQLLNKMQQEQPIEMNIHSTPGAGTTVSLLFKNWLA